MKSVELLILEYNRKFPEKTLSLLRALVLFYRDPGFRVLIYLRYATKGNILFFRKRCCRILNAKYGVAISMNTKIGSNLQIHKMIAININLLFFL